MDQHTQKKSSILRFFPFTKGFRGKFLLAFLMVIVAVVANYMTPQVIRVTVDSVINDTPFNLPAFLVEWIESIGGREMLRQHIVICAAVSLVFAVIAGLSNYSSRMNLARACEGTVARVRDTLQKHGAMDYSIIVSSSASESAPMQYIAPYAGAAMGEYFMGKGKDVLIVYDDLSKHAVAYRTLSLLLKRSPGREAYPGDVFYLHSRLLERACRLTKEYGGGSMTALPIIETQAGDVSAYIPTNVISITDGQIYLETDLFFAGQRPAVNVGLSVSRVGGAAQTRAIKKTAGTLRIDLARFRELEVFTQFASDLDPATQQALDHGRRLLELLKQPLYHPMPVSRQAIILYVATSGLVDDVPLDRVRQFVLDFADEMETEHADVVEEIQSTGNLSGPAVETIRAALDDAKKRGSATWQA